MAQIGGQIAARGEDGGVYPLITRQLGHPCHQQGH